MVKKNKETSLIEKQILNSNQDLDEEFVTANDFIINEVHNEEERDDLNEFEEKDDMLIEKLKSLDGKQSKRLRTEVVRGELDVNITTKNDPNSVHKIKAYELLSSLKDVSEAGTLKKIFSKAQKRTKVLETPLPKHMSEKAQRIASYIEEKKEVSEWDPVVKRNRLAEQLIFPLKQPDYSMQTASSFSKTWKPETDLEKQVAELLETSENNLKDQKLLTPAELKAIQSMSLEEVKQKRAEFLKLKALQSYQEAKFKRLKNIKSKKYRKILKKQREKEEKKSLENLEKEDPTKFKEVLQDMEKQRMKERMSLKHKNTSKWAKQQAIYGKFNETARQQVQEQLEIAKNLTKKLKEFEVDHRNNEDEKLNQNSINGDEIVMQNVILENNPWMNMMSGVSGVVVGKTQQNQSETGKDVEYSKPKAYKNNKEIEKAKRDLEDLEEDEESDEEIIDRDNIKDVISVLKDDSESESDEEKIEKQPSQKIKLKKEKIIEVTELKSYNSQKHKEKENSEEKTHDNVEVNLKPITQEIVFNNANTNGNSKSSEKPQTNIRQNNPKDHQLTLSEAFADDDVIEEFEAEKKAVIENERVKSIDLTMPGWGGWAGAGIDPNQEKKLKNKNHRKCRKKLIIRPSETIKSEEDKQQLIRRDKDLAHVIISEKKILELQNTNQLPHQFNNVHDFENKIAQPIGRTWNPDFKFRKLIMPKVKSKLGSIIEPIDKEDIVKNIKKGKK